MSFLKMSKEGVGIAATSSIVSLALQFSSCPASLISHY